MIIFLSEIQHPQAARLAQELQDAGLEITVNAHNPHHVRLLFLRSSTLQTQPKESFADQTITTIPVLLEPCTVPDALQENLVDISSNYLLGYRKLMQLLHKIAYSKAFNPYISLRPYREFQSPLFYISPKLIHTLQQALSENTTRLVTLLGASGSGKTSAIQAGLLPKLRDEDPLWLPLYIEMDDGPFSQLAAILKPLVNNPESTIARLFSAPRVLSEMLAEQSNQAERPILILDSFESLFTRVPVSDRVYFLDALYQAVTATTGSYAICIILRDGFQKRLAEYPKWAELLQKNVFSMPDLSADDVRQIITKPASLSNLPVEERCAELIYKDIALLPKSSQMLRLSFGLATLYEKGGITRASYKQIGSINSVFSDYIEAVFEQLTPVQQLAVRQILLQFLELSDESEDYPVSRALPRTQFAFSWISANDLDQTLTQMMNANLLIEYLNIEENKAYLRLSHGHMYLEWPRYGGWVQDNIENLRYRSRVEKLASSWVAKEYSEQALLRGTALDETLNWLKTSEYLPSEQLQNYIAVSQELRKTFDTREKTARGLRTQFSRANLILLVGVTVLLGLVSFVAANLLQERDLLASAQATANSNLSTATTEKLAFDTTSTAAATLQSGVEAELATSVANADLASTAQANAEKTQEAVGTHAAATLNAMATVQATNATAIAQVEAMQVTIDAGKEAEKALKLSIAQNLAQTAEDVLNTNPTFALRLAAEAGSIHVLNGADSTDEGILQSLRDAIQANLSLNYGGAPDRVWFLADNTFAVLDYAAGQDELWQMKPLQRLAQLPGPVEQIIPIRGGQWFLVDYANATPDALWKTADYQAVAHLNGDIAPQPDNLSAVKIPNVVPLEQGAYFVVKYEADKPSELWDTEAGKLLKALDGDLETVLPLADGLFFTSYIDHSITGNIVEAGKGKVVESANEVSAAGNGKDIFILRRNGQFDEIWRTNPLGKITSTVGRVDTVAPIVGSPYYIVQYQGGKPSEIWRWDASPELVYSFNVAVDISPTYLNGQYFFVRYTDTSPSQIWATSPLEPVVTLNGILAKMNIDTVLGQEKAIIDYRDNVVSELWSLKDGSMVMPLDGNVAQVVPMMGDTYFAVRYEDHQSITIWNAVDNTLVVQIGDSQQHITTIKAIKDGAYLAILYQNVPAELWQISTDQATLGQTLPDVATDIFPLDGVDFFIVNYVSLPSQIWSISSLKDLVHLPGIIDQWSYSNQNMVLSYSITPDRQVYQLDLNQLAAVEADSPALSYNDLLTIACAQIGSQPPDGADLSAYLGGLSSTSCSAPAN